MQIPLWLSAADFPIRKPKITEINTVPTPDEWGVSDWSTHTMFYGAAGALTTNISGYFLTPTTPVVSLDTNQLSSQLNPTPPGDNSNTFFGYSYADVIWAYLQGKLNQPSVYNFVRTDPTQYIDPYGNVYRGPVIQQFTADYTVGITTKQPFTMTLYLEV